MDKYRLFDDRIISYSELRTSVSLRRWQEDALKLWERDNRGIISVVTGGGKTRFAYTCMLAFNYKYGGGRIIIVVPTVSLLDQWYVTLVSEYKVPQSAIACFGGGKRGAPQKINIVVLNTARKAANFLKGTSQSFLIVDECHRAGSICNSVVLSERHDATLGLSATPERTDDGLSEHLVPNLGEVIFTYDYASAKRDGIISDFELVNIQFDLNEPEQQKYDALSAQIIRVDRSKRYSTEEKQKKLKILLQRRASISNNALMRIPIAVRLADKHPKDKFLYFHESIAAARSIYELLVSRRYNIGLYHSRMSEGLRQSNLLMLRQGMLSGIVACRALDEGVDIPSASIAIIASGTASTRQRIQRLGRVLRPAKGKKSAVIYTLFATRPERERLMREAEQLRDVASVRWQRVARE